MAAGLGAPPVRAAIRPVASKVDLSNPYAIQLMLSKKPIDRSAIPKLPVGLRRYRLYISESNRNGKTIYQLRLGFFATAREAATHQGTLSKLFPGNWVTRVPVIERRESIRTQIVQAKPKIVTPKTRKTLRELSPEEEQRLIRLMDEGRKAVTRGDYDRAIQIYTGVLKIPDHSYQQDALEFLGLSRERNGQLAHAKAQYEHYLELYPDGPGASRVRQRLAGIVTASNEPKEKLKRSKRGNAKVTWNFNGSASQYYRYNVAVDQTGNTDELESSISTDLDLNLRRRGGSYNLRSRFSGDHRYDFLQKGSVSRLQITTVYVDVSQRGGPWSGRVGRQTQTSGGVLGRYDGFTAGYRLAPKRQINLVAGFPVDIANSEQITTKTHFFGLNADLGTYAEAWDFNLFAIQQVADGITDRRAIGTEVRYFRTNRSLFGLYDYDVLFGKTNTMLLLGNLTLPDKSTLNMMVDIRKSPVLTTSNALQGQTVSTIDALVDLLGESTTRDVALDRTPTSRTLTFGGTHPLNDRVQLNADLTLSRLGASPASAGVSAIPKSAQEYFFNGQVIVNRLLRDNDVTILGGRYANTTTARSVSLLFNTRYPVGTRWRLNPRARLDLRDNFTDQSKYVALFPSFRADYRVGRQMLLEVEVGGDWTNNFFNGDTETTYGYYITAGYRLSF